MNWSKVTGTAAFVVSAILACAQPGGNLGQLELKVTDKYKARVGEAVKYNSFPDFKDTTSKKIPVNYGITSHPIEVKFDPEPLSPARIAKVPVEELYRGMVRLGYGLYNTPLLEAYYNSGRSSTYNFGFYGRHFSTQQGVKNIIYENNGLSTNRLGAFLDRFYNKFKWSTEAYGRFDKVTYYGIEEDEADTSLYNPEVDEELKPDANWYRQFGIKSTLYSTSKNGLGWMQKGGIEYYHLSDNYNTAENYFSAVTAFEIPADDKTIDLDLNATYFQTVYDSLSDFDQGYFTLQMRPHIDTYINDILFQLGINLYYNSLNASYLDETDGSIYFFPQVKVSYPVVEDVLTVFGGIDGFLQQNTVRTLVDDNPFINPGQVLNPTRHTDLFIGMNGILSSTTSFDVRGGFMDVNEMNIYYRDPFYYTDTVDPGLSVLYADADIFYVRGELGVNLRNNLQASVWGDLRSYNVKDNDSIAVRAWHLPAFRAGLDLVYTFREKIKLNTRIRYIGPREAFVQEVNPLISNRLEGYVNAGLGVEYLYNSRLSAFLNVYNILNSQYDRYLGYRAQSINFLLGIGYQF